MVTKTDYSLKKGLLMLFAAVVLLVSSFLGLSQGFGVSVADAEVEGERGPSHTQEAGSVEAQGSAATSDTATSKESVATGENGAGGTLAKASSSKRSRKSSKRNRATAEESSAAVITVSGRRPVRPGTLRVATWNLHDFFDAVDDSYNDEVLSLREFASKLDSLKAGLDDVNADIVGVCEVENLACLRKLGERAGYPYVLLVPGNDRIRGINVGVLSRIPIKNYVSHTRDRFRNSAGRNGAFSRDCLEVHFAHSSRLTLLVNHLKSQRGQDKEANDAKRASQAGRVREIAAGLSSVPVVIVGDMNADPDSPSLRPLLGAKFLTDVMQSIPAKSRVTFKNSRYTSALDYILVNQKLAPAVEANSVRIYATPNVARASDHRPVSVDLRLSR